MAAPDPQPGDSKGHNNVTAELTCHKSLQPDRQGGAALDRVRQTQDQAGLMGQL